MREEALPGSGGGRRPGPVLLFWIPLLILLAGSFLIRYRTRDAVSGSQGFWFWDNDTVRRLCRLELISRSRSYPVRNLWDGYPEGSVIHWTRPMDWTIQALDGPASLLFPQARKWEAGAALAGPLLSLLALLVLLLALRRLWGPGPALAAGLFYAFSYSCVNVSWFGNGDHQNLQHLLLLASLLTGLLAVERGPSRKWAFLSGALTGAAVWVTTESLLFLYAAALLLFLREWALAWGKEKEEEGRILLPWAGGLVLLLLAGHLVEHPGRPGAFLWDQISLLQLLQGGALLLFALLQARRLPRRGRPFSSAGTALLLFGILLFTFFDDALVRQASNFRRLNPWLQNCVSEYRTLFTDGASFTLLPAFRRFSFLLAALPLLLPALLKSSRLSRRSAVGLWILAVCAFALASWEVKLAHLFSLVFPLLLGLAAWEAPAILGREGEPGAGTLRLGALGLVAWAALTSLPVPPHRIPQLAQTEELTAELCRDLYRLDGGGKKGSVLAPWDLGAKLMYYARVPVVASGYHRNIRGILDGLEIYTARPGKEEAAARRILERRRVGFVVTTFDRLFLAWAPAVLGKEVRLAEARPRGPVFFPEAEKTLFWRLRYGRKVPGFSQVKEADALVGLRPDSKPEPFYRIFRFTP